MRYTLLWQIIISRLRIVDYISWDTMKLLYPVSEVYSRKYSPRDILTHVSRGIYTYFW